VTWKNPEKKFPVWNCLSHCLRRGLWNPICRNGSMTSTGSFLTLAGDHLAQFLRTHAGSRAMTRFAAAGLSDESVHDLNMLVGQRGRAISRLRRVRIVDVLTPVAPSDSVAGLCTVVALRPELLRISRRASRALVDPEDTEADVVAVAWKLAITGPGGGAEPFRHATLVNAIWTEVRGSAGLRRGQLEVVPLDDDFDRPAPLDDPLERWPGLLAAAVARGVLTPRQVVLIAQTRMEGRPLIEVAATLGRTYDSARMDRARAEAALRQFALSSFETDEQ
jgi:DNA-directed RNA polymerase specialized sigma24 family protein